jgi:nicotinamidase-related amidase
MAKTLLQLSGADLTPPALSETVLLLIDAQREYVDGKLPLPSAEAALSNIARLLEKARAAGAPVVHVQHKGKAGGLFDPGSTAFELAAEASARDGETIVEKGLPNAFAGTSLKDVLDATGRKRLVVAGFMTHMCISSTVRAGLDLGFQSVVVADACATRDLPAADGSGEVVAADALHRAELAMLADRFAIVCTTGQLAG